jgi:hypothetical protein
MTDKEEGLVERLRRQYEQACEHPTSAGAMRAFERVASDAIAALASRAAPAAPAVEGRAIGWYFWDGEFWTESLAEIQKRAAPPSPQQPPRTADEEKK